MKRGREWRQKRSVWTSSRRSLGPTDVAIFCPQIISFTTSLVFLIFFFLMGWFPKKNCHRVKEHLLKSRPIPTAHHLADCVHKVRTPWTVRENLPHEINPKIKIWNSIMYVKSKTGQKWTCLWNRNRLRDTENRLVVAKGDGYWVEQGRSRTRGLAHASFYLQDSTGNYIQYSVITIMEKMMKKNIYV